MNLRPCRPKKLSSLKGIVSQVYICFQARLLAKSRIGNPMRLFFLNSVTPALLPCQVTQYTAISSATPTPSSRPWLSEMVWKQAAPCLETGLEQKGSIFVHHVGCMQDTHTVASIADSHPPVPNGPSENPTIVASPEPRSTM